MLWFFGQRQVNRRSHTAKLLFGLAVGMALHVPLVGQTTEVPSEAGGQADGHQRGAIVVAVTFGRDGKVQICRLVRSNVPFQLEASAIDHIQKHWGCSFFAGETVVLPIVYHETNPSVRWNDDMAPPPDVFPYDNKTYAMKLRVSFASDGWVKRVQVIEPSGIELADKQTAEWIQVHWHHDAYANEVVDAPFEFSRALPPPPAVPPAPKPAPPEQPVAIPAIRVE